jgi:hypothetical protein
LEGLGSPTSKKKKKSVALRMRCLWHEWNDENKPWIGLGTPCTPQDMDLFAAATKVTIGNGKKAIFWEAPWLNGMRLKDEVAHQHHSCYFSLRKRLPLLRKRPSTKPTRKSHGQPHEDSCQEISQTWIVHRLF